MFALSVVCSRGGSRETSKTRQCVGLAIQRSLIRVHKSFFSPIFRSSPGQQVCLLQYGNHFFLNCKMNVFDVDLQANYDTTPYLSDLLPDSSHHTRTVLTCNHFLNVYPAFKH